MIILTLTLEGQDLMKEITQAASYLESHSDTEAPEYLNAVDMKVNDRRAEAEIEHALARLERGIDEYYAEQAPYSVEGMIKDIKHAAEPLDLEYDSLPYRTGEFHLDTPPEATSSLD